MTLEVCPGSNVALGVYADPAQVPLRTIVDAGIPVALGADDPLLFGSRLTAQIALARDELGFSDVELAALARQSLDGAGPPRTSGRPRWPTSTRGRPADRGLVRADSCGCRFGRRPGRKAR